MKQASAKHNEPFFSYARAHRNNQAGAETAKLTLWAIVLKAVCSIALIFYFWLKRFFIPGCIAMGLVLWPDLPAKTAEKDPLLRNKLNQAMTAQDVPGTIATLMNELQTNPSPLIRKGAAELLARHAQDAFVSQALATALDKDPAPEVRYACALSLALSNTFIALKALEKAADDPDPLLRRQAAFSLKRHRSAQAKKILERLSDDEDAAVRETARRKE